MAEILTKMPRKKMTISEYFTETPEGHFELIDGMLLEPPSPGYSHQSSSFSLARKLADYVDQYSSGVVIVAPMDVVLGEDVVQPDILFISNERKNIIRNSIYGAPDFVVEIISQGTLRHDTIRKKAIYEKSGVKEYWIVFPEKRMIEVFALKEEKFQSPKKFHKEDFVISEILKGFSLKADEIFFAI